MQLRNISRLATLPVALGLLFTSAAPSNLAAHTHKRHCHANQHSCPKSAGCPSEKDVMCTLMCDGSFKNLTAAIKKAGLAKTLEGKGTFTLFAPEDKAFWKKPKGFMDDLSKDPKKLNAVLTYHVLPKKLTSSELSGSRAVKTVEGEDLMVDSRDGKVEVDGALVTRADIKCRNGVIHVIDEVLIPERGK